MIMFKILNFVILFNSIKLGAYLSLFSILVLEVLFMVSITKNGYSLTKLFVIVTISLITPWRLDVEFWPSGTP